MTRFSLAAVATFSLLSSAAWAGNGESAEIFTLRESPACIFPVGANGELLKAPAFAGRDPRCERDSRIVAALKPRPRIQKAELEAMEKILAPKIEKVKECFQQHYNWGDTECRDMASSLVASHVLTDQNGWTWTVTVSETLSVSGPVEKKPPYSATELAFSISESRSAAPERVGPIVAVFDMTGRIVRAEKRDLRLASEALTRLKAQSKASR